MKGPNGWLNGKAYYYAFLAGAKKILENQKELNRINVFPVPDADTGSNLASTVRAIIERVRPHRSYKVTSAAIAAAALEGARGNSGVIFAQFLYGIGAESRDSSEVSLAHFGQSVRSAVRYMYEAIAEPAEGTMITVIRKWAESVASPKEESEGFLKVLNRAHARAVEALQETRFKIEAIRRANVVDAGSKGMVLFLEGMIDFLAKPSHKKILSVRKNAAEIEPVVEVPSGTVRRRYCTEALIKPSAGREGSGLDKEELKREIAAFGDSLVIAGSKEALRFHVHTDTPAELFYKIRNVGGIVFQKADDMLRQYEAAHSRKWPVAIVTDSCCDLPAEVLDHYQVHVVPLRLSFGDSPYLDKVTITPDQLCRMLDERKEFPKTAQPASLRESVHEPGRSLRFDHRRPSLAEAERDLFDEPRGRPPRLRAVGEANHGHRFPDPVRRQGLLVLRIARLIEAGGSHSEAVAEAERLLPQAKVLVAVQTLKYMVRGGRVSPMAGAAAKLLNLKPIVSMGESGGSKMFDKAFSQRGILRKILGHLRADASAGRVEDYCILHAHNPKDALAYAAEVESVFGRKPAFTMDISPAIGSNAGAVAVAVAFLREG